MSHSTTLGSAWLGYRSTDNKTAYAWPSVPYHTAPAYASCPPALHPDKEMTGTFRWPEHVPLQLLDLSDTSAITGIGWGAFLQCRRLCEPQPARTPAKPVAPDSDDAMLAAVQPREMKLGSKRVRVHPALLDGMSWPMTAVHAIRTMDWHPQPCHCSAASAGTTWHPAEVFVVLAGASRRAEQRIVQDANYMHVLVQELAKREHVAAITLVLAGPEIEYVPGIQQHSSSSSVAYQRVGLMDYPSAGTPSAAPQVHVVLCKAALHDVLATPEHPGVVPGQCAENTLVIAYNSGMGNRNAALRASWMPSLRAIADGEYSAVFTAANSSVDLAGEQVTLRVAAAQQGIQLHVTHGPHKNPWAAATMLGSPAGADAEDSEPYCANSFWYAVSGSKPRLHES